MGTLADTQTVDFVPLVVKGVYRGEEPNDVTLALNRAPSDEELAAMKLGMVREGAAMTRYILGSGRYEGRC